MNNKIKALGGFVTVMAGNLLAQSSGSTSVDVSAAEGAIDGVGTAINSLLTGKVMTNVLLIIGAGLAIAMIFLGIRWMLRGGKAAAK